MIHSVAHAGYTPEQLAHWRSTFPRKVADDGPLGRAILTRSVDLVKDVESERGRSIGPDALANMRARGSRSVLTVPMMREGKVIGAISLAHRDVNGFSDAQVELLRTFADQAVIAIENVRLFNELEALTQDLTRSVNELRALGEVGQAISSTLDVETLLTTIVSRAVELSRLDGGVVFEYDAQTGEFVQRAATEQGGELAAARRARRIRRGEGVVGQTAVTLEPAQVPDILPESAYVSPLRENLVQSGIRAVLAVPMLWEGRLIGSLVVSRNSRFVPPAPSPPRR
jgi:GAF domain-containing protein